MGRKMLPIGIEFFDEMREKDYYYIDKTGMIREFLANQSKVTLFTRPRRFGKSLNMSMLASFFSVDGDKRIFDGLEISRETELCEKHMGKHPVISISLKEIEGLNYEMAFQQAVSTIRAAARKVGYLRESSMLGEQDKAEYQALLNRDMAESTLRESLRVLSELLEKHYGAKAVLLLDEYDVPLQKAFAYGYYDQMVSLIRGMMGAALKTNASLEFAVLTGCLRIAKESIFTGLNNLAVFSIMDEMYDGYFGFTDQEVRDLLAYYGIEECYEEIRRWYDGYQFGGQEVYCPWDVLNHCLRLLKNPKTKPENYWINTSGNDAVRRFVEMANDATRQEIESLVASEAIEKEIRKDLTYSEMYDSIENLWSLLFMTGYLTQRGEAGEGLLRLAIPNLEVRDIFVRQIREYFKESVRADGDTLNRFCDALQNGDAENVQKLFSQYLQKSISIRDAMAREEQKENFYHGVLLGILLAKDGWDVKSNREGGDGYADILAIPEYGDPGIGIVIEMKYAHGGDMDAAGRDALSQVEDRRYEEALRREGMDTILKYGIGCYKKRCRVALGEVQVKR